MCWLVVDRDRSVKTQVSRGSQAHPYRPLPLFVGIASSRGVSHIALCNLISSDSTSTQSLWAFIRLVGWLVGAKGEGGLRSPKVVYTQVVISYEYDHQYTGLPLLLPLCRNLCTKTEYWCSCCEVVVIIIIILLPDYQCKCPPFDRSIPVNHHHHLHRDLHTKCIVRCGNLRTHVQIPR